MEAAAAGSLNLDPLLLAATGLLIGLVAWMIRRGGSTTRRPWLCLSGAALLLVGVWLTPLATIGQHYLLSAHLVQLTVLMGAVPPLVLLALPRDPHLRLPRAVRLPLRVAVHPLVAIVGINAAFFVWHVSSVYTATMASNWLYSLMQITLLLTSLAFWWPIIQPCSRPGRGLGSLAKMGYILLATIPQTFGGLVVALAHHSLYPGYASAPRVLGLDVMTDQQIAGASIALVSKIALFTAFIIIFMHALSTPAPGTDDGGGGDGGIRPVNTPRPLPSGTPRWLLDVERDRTVSEPPARPRVRVPAGSGSGRD